MIRLLVAAAASVIATTASAATPPALCPNGEIAIVRISKIAPGGSMEGFKAAMADHAKWYSDHGYTADREVLAPVIVSDPSHKDWSIAQDQVVTLHTHAQHVPDDKHDAGWDKFVAEYRANSQIVQEAMICLPK
jgi:hypothetical protein